MRDKKGRFTNEYDKDRGGFKKGHPQFNTGRTHFKKGNHPKTEFKKGIIYSWTFKKGHKVPKEWRNKTSIANKNKRRSPKTEFQKGIIPKNCWKKGNVPWNKGILNLKMREYYKNPKWKEKQLKAVLKGLMKRPTSFEQKIILLCSKHKLPFIYTGDGRVLIGFKNPDFINEEKKIIIEVFLDYFKIRDFGSIKNYMKKREKHFANFGYKTIFINQQEIENKNWEEICLNKIKCKEVK